MICSFVKYSSVEIGILGWSDFGKAYNVLGGFEVFMMQSLNCQRYGICS